MEATAYRDGSSFFFLGGRRTTNDEDQIGTQAGAANWWETEAVADPGDDSGASLSVSAFQLSQAD